VKFSVLSDAKAVDGYGSEHGLSFLIEVDHKKFLFDTGASDLYLRNAEKLGLNMAELDAIVLSHGHFDHGNGLQYIKEKPLVCHPDCFVKRYRKSGKGYLGLALSEREIRKRFDLKTSREPVQLSEHLFFLGEVPRDNDFESQHTKYQLEDGSEDFIRDDSGLACISEGRLVVFSGCAHSGICNMVEHARKVTGIKQVHAVIGGFHLKQVNWQTKRTIVYLKELRVKRIYPSHCTQDPALSRMVELFDGLVPTAGTQYVF
jgi:7,8-dihydropterin-6-yl-methyl-4-(beta-D-ribofuranosyl)aminobenzene 5'-phosphate synthase